MTQHRIGLVQSCRVFAKWKAKGYRPILQMPQPRTWKMEGPVWRIWTTSRQSENFVLRMSLSNVYDTQVFAKKHSKETLVHGQNLPPNLDARCEVRWGVCVCVSVSQAYSLCIFHPCCEEVWASLACEGNSKSLNISCPERISSRSSVI